MDSLRGLKTESSDILKLSASSIVQQRQLMDHQRKLGKHQQAAFEETQRPGGS